MKERYGSSVSELPCFLFPFDDVVPAKQERNAPQTCQAYKGIDQSAEQGTGAAKEPGNQIELKNSHKSPVETTDDSKDQGNCIHICTSISSSGAIRICSFLFFIRNGLKKASFFAIIKNTDDERRLYL